MNDTICFLWNVNVSWQEVGKVNTDIKAILSLAVWPLMPSYWTQSCLPKSNSCEWPYQTVYLFDLQPSLPPPPGERVNRKRGWRSQCSNESGCWQQQFRYCLKLHICPLIVGGGECLKCLLTVSSCLSCSSLSGYVGSGWFSPGNDCLKQMECSLNSFRHFGTKSWIEKKTNKNKQQFYYHFDLTFALIIS